MSIKNFEQFESQLNESEDAIKDVLKTVLPSLMMGDPSAILKSLGVEDKTKTPAPTPSAETDGGGESKIGTIDGKAPKPLPTVSKEGKGETGKDKGATIPGINQIPGNDDFLLYMQHQQGVAGATCLIKASMGIGRLHPDTVKRKSGVNYANLIMNVPSDRPKIKQAIIQSLDKGDQKVASLLFMTMWKEKWNSKSKKAKEYIDEPKNSKVKSAIKTYCDKYNVPYDFAITVAMIESGFNPKSGNKRYKGLFALSQSEFSEYVKGGDIYNINDNAKAGVLCLKNNIKAFVKYLGPKLAANIKIGDWARYA